MTIGEKILAALQSYKLKEAGDGQWRCNSPLRPGSNSHAFSLTIDGDGESGAYYDHVTEERGSLADLAQKLGIALPERTSVQDTKRSYAGLADYAAAHGSTADLFTKAGWREIFKDNRPALVFSTKNGDRYRFIDGEKPVYKSVPGYKRCWYGLNVSALQRIAAGQALVLCNGEASTVVGKHYGLAACCITGGEKSEIPPDLLDELKAMLGDASPVVIVAFDCLDKGADAGPKVAAQLRAAGLNARAVDLGLGKGGDLADFCMLYGESVATDLEKLPTLATATSELPPLRPRRQILHVSELKDLPPLKWLVPGEIPERGLTVLFGPSGVGKSFVALDYALRLAETMCVVYVAAEGEAGFQRRVAAWFKHHKKSDDRAHSNLYFVMGDVTLFDQAEITSFIDDVKPLAPKLVIIDTLARVMVGGDENSTRDMGIFVRACNAIQHQIDGAVMVVHHTGKLGSVERGNSSLRAACDSMIKLYGDDDVIRMESSKTKDAAAFPTRYYKLLPIQLPDGTESRILIAASKIEWTRNDPLTAHQQKILEALSLEVFADGAADSDLVDTTEINRGSVQRVLSALIRREYVAQDANRAPYKITAAGRDALERQRKLGVQLSFESIDSVGTTPIDSVDSIIDSVSTPQVNLGGMPIDSVDSVDSVSFYKDLMQSSQKPIGTTESTESMESNNQLTLPRTTAPSDPYPEQPCPVCGSPDWNRSRITGGWYCYSCAETKRRALLPPTSE